MSLPSIKDIAQKGIWGLEKKLRAKKKSQRNCRGGLCLCNWCGGRKGGAKQNGGWPSGVQNNKGGLEGQRGETARRTEEGDGLTGKRSERKKIVSSPAPGNS